MKAKAYVPTPSGRVPVQLSAWLPMDRFDLKIHGMKPLVVTDGIAIAFGTFAPVPGQSVFSDWQWKLSGTFWVARDGDEIAESFKPTKFIPLMEGLR